MPELLNQLQRFLGSAYTIERELGGGGMSRVFLVHDSALDRRIVVKILPPELAEGLSAERFSREMRLAATLQQANIVPLISVGEAAGLPYYTMPFVDGDSLRNRLASVGRFSAGEGTRILRDVARALAYAHGRGIVHRDIKPDNVLLSAGAAVVTDFGIAKALVDARSERATRTGGLTAAGVALGTPGYLSPEQAVGDSRVDERSDIYSFGCLAYELFTGNAPFGDRPVQKLIAAHITERPAPIGSLAELPKQIADLVMQCLEKNPADRPGSMTEILATLDSATQPMSPRTSARYSRGLAVVAVGAVAFAAWMTLIRPRTLLASGKVSPHERIIIAEFGARGQDTTLASVVTEAFRVGMTQSEQVVPVSAAMITDALRRMNRPISTRVDAAVAHEIAMREGLRALIQGEVLDLGGSYTISATLLAAASGESLASSQERAESSKEILPATDRLAKALRQKIGESLRTLNAAPPLAQVTTSSLDALRKYVQGMQAFRVEGNIPKGTALLEEAIAIDTGFAMAYLDLSRQLGNQHDQEGRAAQLLEHAYRHRDRLSDVERYATMSEWYGFGPHQDLSKAIAAYEALIDLQPENAQALNNVANFYKLQRNFIKAESFYRRAIKANPLAANPYVNLGGVELILGERDSIRSTMRSFAAAMKDNPSVTMATARFATVDEQYDSAYDLLASALRTRSDVSARTSWTPLLADISELRGRIGDALRWRTEQRATARQRGSASAHLVAALDSIYYDVAYGAQPARSANALDATLRRYPLDSLSVMDRPYDQVVHLYVLAGSAQRARAIASEFDRSRDTLTLIRDSVARHQIRGDLAIAEHRYMDAVREYELSDAGQCVTCALPRIARAYDLGGQPDSAIAYYERYIHRQGPLGLSVDAEFLASAHERLGRLYQQKGDAARAAEHIRKFASLWSNADAALRPRVDAALRVLGQPQEKTALRR